MCRSGKKSCRSVELPRICQAARSLFTPEGVHFPMSPPGITRQIENTTRVCRKCEIPFQEVHQSRSFTVTGGIDSGTGNLRDSRIISSFDCGESQICTSRRYHYSYKSFLFRLNPSGRIFPVMQPCNSVPIAHVAQRCLQDLWNCGNPAST